MPAVTITITVDAPPPKFDIAPLVAFNVGTNGRYASFPPDQFERAVERWFGAGMGTVHLYAVYEEPGNIGHELLREWSGVSWPHRRSRA